MRPLTPVVIIVWSLIIIGLIVGLPDLGKRGHLVVVSVLLTTGFLGWWVFRYESSHRSD